MIRPYIPVYPPGPQSAPGNPGEVEDYLLELILIDTIACADPARDLAAEHMIERCIPTEEYERVMDLYDELSDDDSEDANLLPPWYARACAKGSWWKIQMIAKLLYVAAGGQIVTTEALADVAALAERIDAIPELRTLLLMEAKQDTESARDDPSRTKPPSRHTLQTGLAGA